MKRIILIAVILIGAFFVIFPQISFTPPKIVRTTGTVQESPRITVMVNTGSTVATESGVSAQNAFQALEKFADKQNLKLTTKQYNFGVFVQAVGSFVNTTDKSWIYFVNGKAGTVAADKQSVVNNDMVEWQYTKPTAE